jgi:hypothetical protein
LRSAASEDIARIARDCPRLPGLKISPAVFGSLGFLAIAFLANFSRQPFPSKQIIDKAFYA